MGRRRWIVAAAVVGLAGSLGGPIVTPPPAVAAPPPPGVVATRVRFEPLDPATTGMSADGGAGHRGAVEVAAGGEVVVEVPVDAYVRGIQEVPPSWPTAAQQAQAIAARSFALDAARKARARAGHRPTDADLCATESCQVYRGLAGEQRAGGGAWVAAADATAGQVLLSGGQPIFAKYSSSNGGRSIPGGQDYLRAVDDPDDAASPLHRWTATLPAAAVAAALGIPGTIVDARRDGGTVILTWQSPSSPSSSSPPADPPPGDPADPAPPTSSPPPTDPPPARSESRFTIGEFRSRVGARVAPSPGLPRTFPSDQLTLRFDSSGPAVVADGRGFGHGIGLSQFGALGKARRGVDAAGILAAYYGGLRPAPVPASSPRTLRVSLPGVAAPVVQAVPTSTAPAGAFRVVADGKVVATVASGRWAVAPGPTPGTVRVVSPDDQAVPLVVDEATASRAAGTAESPVLVSFRTTLPALVSVAGAPTMALPAGAQQVAVPGGGGARSIPLTVDAGGGRVATTAVDLAALPVAAPEGAPVVAPAEAGPAEDPADALPEAIGFDLAGPAPVQAGIGPRATGQRSPALVLVAAALVVAAFGAATRTALARRRRAQGAGSSTAGP